MHNMILTTALAVTTAAGIVAPRISPEATPLPVAAPATDPIVAFPAERGGTPFADGYDPGYVAGGDLALYGLMEDRRQDLDEAHCGARADIGEKLRDGFEETPVTAMTSTGGLDLELWGSAEQATWTIVHHGRDGISCVVASGLGWNSDTDAQALIASQVF